jgi:hypothetical protein
MAVGVGGSQVVPRRPPPSAHSAGEKRDERGRFRSEADFETMSKED